MISSKPDPETRDTMKRPDITPGPWKWSGTNARPSRSCYLTSANEPYGNVDASLEGFTENKADAKAIAALPDLLDALEKVLGTYPEHMPNPNDNYSPCKCSSCNAIRMARAALLKAGYTFD